MPQISRVQLKVAVKVTYIPQVVNVLSDVRIGFHFPVVVRVLRFHLRDKCKVLLFSCCIQTLLYTFKNVLLSENKINLYTEMFLILWVGKQKFATVFVII
jgi:hypothetical protein